MKKSGKILLFCTFVFCITLVGGCEDAPAPVNEEGIESQAALESDKFVSVEEAKDQLGELEGKTVSGIVFPEHIVMPDTDEIPVLELSPWNEKHSDMYVLEETLGHIWDPYKEADWSSAEERKFTNPGYDESYAGITKRDKSTGYAFSIDSDGLIYGNSLENSGDIGLPSVSSCIAEYDFEWGDPETSDVYELEDGEISVHDAVSYTEALFKDYVSGLEEDMFEYRVQQLYVIKEDEGYCDFNIVVGRCYKKINICTTGSYHDEGEEEYDFLHEGDQILVVMRHKNTLDFVDVWKGLYNAEVLTGSQEIVSPLWAVQLIEGEIAHIGNMHLNKCGLLYVLVEDNKTEISGSSKGKKRYLRPVWLFAQDGRLSAMYSGFAKNIFATAVIVDALDGKLYYYGNSTGAY